jgi:choloylglycine hydrolase
MCTAIRLTTTSGAVVYARTIDFAADARSDVIVMPRRYALMGMALRGEPGMTWTSTYAAVGVNTHGLPLLIDGVNEKGLAVGALYHPGYADYESVADVDASRTLAPVDLPIWLLTRFSGVDAAIQALREVRVGASVFEPLGFVPPLHYVLHDTDRRCSVVEFIDGELMVHDNPLGIVTNAPEFQWHVANLRDCVSRGAGSGTLCLPGDFAAPSRFVRAAALSQAAVPVHTAEEAVQHAFHILGHCEIPRRAAGARAGTGASCDYTQATVAVDTTTRRLYFHTYGNRRVRMVDLMKMRLEAPTLTIFPMDSHEDVQELIAP